MNWQIYRMYVTYIIQSQKNGGYYIGYTSNIDDRLTRHNSGRNRSTKRGMPWKLVYHEEFETRQGAVKREREIKSYKGGVAFKKLINSI